MKTAIYIEDGLVQLVITPESEFEKNALSTFRDKPLDAKLFAGTFYDCRGGWVRQTAYRDEGYRHYADGDRHDQSLILSAREATRDTTLTYTGAAAPPDFMARSVEHDEAHGK